MEMRGGGGYSLVMSKRSREWEQMALNCNLWCSVPFCDQTVIDFLFEGGTEDFAVNTLKMGS